MVTNVQHWRSRSEADVNKGTCAGKKSIAQYLVQYESFVRLQILRDGSSDSQSNQDNHSDIQSGLGSISSFTSVEALLDYVTKHWNGRWLLTDIYIDSILDILQRRPFFILVGVDAPVTLRWERLVRQ